MFFVGWQEVIAINSNVRIVKEKIFFIKVLFKKIIFFFLQGFALKTLIKVFSYPPSKAFYRPTNLPSQEGFRPLPNPSPIFGKGLS